MRDVRLPLAVARCWIARLRESMPMATWSSLPVVLVVNMTNHISIPIIDSRLFNISIAVQMVVLRVGCRPFCPRLTCSLKHFTLWGKKLNITSGQQSLLLWWTS